MIKFIRTLRREITEKNIYIWDVSKRSAWVWEFLALRGIDIAGFVTPCPQYASESLMNRPVITAEDYQTLEGAVLIYEDYTYQNSAEAACRLNNAVRFREALEINPELWNRPLYLYGDTAGAWSLVGEMTRETASAHADSKDTELRQADIRGIFLSDSKGVTSEYGLPVMTFDTKHLEEGDAVVITAVSGTITCHILEVMTDRGFAGDVYVNELVTYIDMWGADPVPVLDRALKEDKKIFLCSEDKLGSEMIRHIFALYEIPVAGEVALHGDPGRGLDDVYSLAGEEPEKTVIFIWALRGLRRAQIVDAAYELGYTAGAMNYVSIWKTCYSVERSDGTLGYEADERFTASIDFTTLGGCPGWAVWGDPSDEAVRIMVLGGSTSSDIYYPESWVKRLSRLIREAGLHARIYNGAHERADSEQEFRRMCRDLNVIRPHIVISMSGINDMTKYDDKFDKWNPESTFARWRRIQTYMKDTAEKAGAAYYAFLQPINNGLTQTNLHENLLFIHDSIRRGGSFYMEPVDNDFYTNLFGLFHHRNGMLLDVCHYSDEGNEEIAQIVFDTIKDRLS